MAGSWGPARLSGFLVHLDSRCRDVGSSSVLFSYCVYGGPSRRAERLLFAPTETILSRQATPCVFARFLWPALPSWGALPSDGLEPQPRGARSLHHSPASCP